MIFLHSVWFFTHICPSIAFSVAFNPILAPNRPIFQQFHQWWAVPMKTQPQFSTDQTQMMAVTELFSITTAIERNATQLVELLRRPCVVRTNHSHPLATACAYRKDYTQKVHRQDQLSESNIFLAVSDAFSCQTGVQGWSIWCIAIFFHQLSHLVSWWRDSKSCSAVLHLYFRQCRIVYEKNMDYGSWFHCVSFPIALNGTTMNLCCTTFDATIISYKATIR